MTETRALINIWLPDSWGNNEQYSTYINHLKQTCEYIDSPFVSEISGKLYWNKIPQKGWQHYMAGFFYTCIKNNWITKQYSAPTIVKILNNTFNARPNVKWFKSISVHKPDDKYLKPYRGLPINK